MPKCDFCSKSLARYKIFYTTPPIWSNNPAIAPHPNTTIKFLIEPHMNSIEHNSFLSIEKPLHCYSLNRNSENKLKMNLFISLFYKKICIKCYNIPMNREKIMNDNVSIKII